MRGQPDLDAKSMARRRWWTLAVLSLSLLIVSIDNGILNVAIPTLVRQLGARPSQVQWIVDAYTLVFGGFLLTGGTLGDRYGRKGVMTVGLVLFGAGSAAAALASNPDQLVLWRAAMGIGAALIMPATLSILVNVFQDEHERRRAIAYWSLMNAGGAFLGPVAGGLLLRNFWWGSCFLVNVPVVVVAILLGRRLVPTSRDPSASRFDPLGAVLSIGALGCLLWTIIEGPVYGWTSAVILASSALTVVLVVAFVMWERRVAHPMIDIATFSSPQFSAAAGAMTIAFMAMPAAMFLITQTLQLVKGYTPLAAALATSLPICAVNFVVMPRSPALTERFGARSMITAGGLLIAAAAVIISTTTIHSGYLNLGLGFATMALAFSIFVPASTEAIMTAVPAEKSGGASAVNQMTRQVGQSLGIAIAGSIAASAYRSGFPAAGLNLDPASEHQARSSITGAFSVAHTLSGAGRQALLGAADQAFVGGVRLAILAAAALAVAGAVFAGVAIPSRRARRDLAVPPTVAELPID